MDVDAQDKQLADLHRDLPPREGDATGQGDLLWQRGGRGDGGGDEVFEEGSLDALGQGVGDGEFGHVVFLFAERDEIVVDAGLVLAGVIKIEVFRLHVVLGELLRFEFGEFFEETRFMGEGHAPDDDGAIFEEEDFGGVDLGVEVKGVGSGGLGLREVGESGVGNGGSAVFEGGVAGGGVEVY